MTFARPFLKWAGGKTKLLQEISSRLPEKIGTYYEPFLGGGAVFFHLAKHERFERAVLSDVNAELMIAYSAVASSPSAVIEFLELHREKHSEEHFYQVRSQDKQKGFNEVIAPKRAARLIYLNRTCFNGLYRVNKAGHFNSPFGDYANPTICDTENLLAAAAAFEKVSIFESNDFESVALTAHRGDAVYFDPPYVPVSKTSNFTGYAAGGFGPDDQERLRNLADKLDARGVFVLLSNADTPEVRELYDGFRIEGVTAPRAINSKGGKRGAVGEVLISGRSTR